MINFLIWSPGFDTNSGGIIALHRLADLIAKSGENSFIYTTHTFEGSSATVVNDNTPLNLIEEETMVIYPEIVSGNPFNAKYVTRWLLNTPGKIGGDGKYDNNDLIYKYYDYFVAPDESKVNGELRTFTLKLDKFYNRGLERNGECYIIKKGRNKIQNMHSLNSVNIDNYVNDDYLSDIFNKTETFVSYDSMTFHIQQAALCGCIPVIIPDEGVTREEFMKKAPVNKVGVAYGFDDIENAKSTLHLVHSHLEEMEKESIELVNEYIKTCYNHMNKPQNIKINETCRRSNNFMG